MFYFHNFCCFSVREEAGTGVAISGPSTLAVVEGQTVELVCSANGRCQEDTKVMHPTVTHYSLHNIFQMKSGFFFNLR